MRLPSNDITPRTKQAKRKRLAMRRARHVLTQRVVGLHTTVLPLEALQEMADMYEQTIEVLSTHEYTDYTSLVYEIF